MSSTISDVAVIGGGISGLACAWHLMRAGIDVCLLEKDHSVGGCTKTLQQDGFLLEQGPFNVLVRDPDFEELLGDLGDDIEVVQASKEAKIRYIYLAGRLVRVPTNPLSMATTKLLGFSAKCRLLAEPFCARKPSCADPTIADFASRHFGESFANNVVGAVVAGIFGGDIHNLSLRACFPSIAQIDRNERSFLLYGLSLPFRRIAKHSKPKRRWPGMVSVTGGLGALTDALGRRLGRKLITDCQVTSIAPGPQGYRIQCRREGKDDEIGTRRIVLATAVRTTAGWVAALQNSPAPELAELLRSIHSVPLVVLNLGFRWQDIGHDLKGFGFLVPPIECDYPLMGVLWASSVFPAHAPSGHHLLRVFIGGSRSPEQTQRDDQSLVNLALEAMRDLLCIQGTPMLVNVVRYELAIPQYHVGHVEKVQTIRQLASQIPGLHLTGNYLEGASLNDCVRLAKQTANEVVAGLA